MDKRKIVIIGGGAAGLLAGAVSAKAGNDVTIIEKNARPARKVMITGKGRCNLTNACFDLQELISNVQQTRGLCIPPFPPLCRMIPSL